MFREKYMYSHPSQINHLSLYYQDIGLSQDMTTLEFQETV